LPKINPIEKEKKMNSDQTFRSENKNQIISCDATAFLTRRSRLAEVQTVLEGRGVFLPSGQWYYFTKDFKRAARNVSKKQSLPDAPLPIVQISPETAKEWAQKWWIGRKKSLFAKPTR
jgi:hypothetical protein